MEANETQCSLHSRPLHRPERGRQRSCDRRAAFRAGKTSPPPTRALHSYDRARVTLREQTHAKGKATSTVSQRPRLGLLARGGSLRETGGLNRRRQAAGKASLGQQRRAPAERCRLPDLAPVCKARATGVAATPCIRGSTTGTERGREEQRTPTVVGLHVRSPRERVYRITEGGHTRPSNFWATGGHNQEA